MEMPAPAEEVELVRVGLVELRRLFQRSELAKEWAAAFGRAHKLDYTELRLLDAVRSTTRTSADDGATVGEVAERLGVDPSRASRLVARAVKRGTLSRHASAGDGRRVVLRVTAAGMKLQERGSELTRARVALALAGWPAAERARFARLFSRFARAIATPGVAGPRSTGGGGAESIARPGLASRGRRRGSR